MKNSKPLLKVVKKMVINPKQTKTKGKFHIKKGITNKGQIKNNWIYWRRSHYFKCGGKFLVPRATIGTWLKSKDTLRAFKNTDKKIMHPGAQPKYKIKDEIISNLRKLRILFNLGDDEDYEENEDFDGEEDDN